MVNKFDYLSDLTVELNKVFPENKNINIVIHGHSQTRGYTMNHMVDMFSSYPHQFHEMLHKRFPCSVTNVIGSGIGGEGSVAGAKHFSDDVLCHKPDLITIDYAINDRESDKFIVKKSWQSMINIAKEKNIPVLLLTPTFDIPSAYNSTKRKEIKYLENMIIELGMENNIGVVEVTKAWEKYMENVGNVEDLLVGVNHSSKLGNKIVANELVSWIPYVGY